MDRSVAAAVFDRIIPADDHPSVVGDRLWTLVDDAPNRDRIGAVLDQLRERASRAGAGAVETLDADALDALIEGLDWHDREVLVQVAALAYYGAADAPGAQMLGYEAGGHRPPLGVTSEPVLAATPFADLDATYDVVVLGAGAGGGVIAHEAAAAGARVLLVERGRALSVAEVGRDHLRNHRTNLLGQNMGPGADGEARVHVDHRGVETVVAAPHDPRWHNNAMGVGGGTRVYMGMAWRFLPDDFHLASIHGVPEDSSLVDWPISYDDLAPHYDWAEWTIGVSGDGSAHPAAGSRSRGYPMAPLPPTTEARVLAAGAERIGLHTGPVPLLLNAEPRDGRAQCVRCGECVGFACLVGAKNGSHNTVVPAALATGNATLVERCRATRLTVDDHGTVTGALLHDEGTGAERTVHAGHVVVACGAIETARLLLASRSPHHPTGLGNGGDQVGRHLQGHAFSSVFGLFEDELIDREGPGISIATLDHNHGEGIIGGVLANEILKLPILHWVWSRHPDAPRWGAASKRSMRETYRRTSHLFTQVQELPRATNRVTLAEGVDRAGMPLVRLEGAAHPRTLDAVRHMLDLGEEWLEASGAHEIWRDRISPDITPSQHQAGTCRMGSDPATSVVDPTGRVHGHANLWVADGSLHPTNGGVNPALTIFAMAHRIAGHLTSA